jgi:hypothetical protein
MHFFPLKPFQHRLKYIRQKIMHFHLKKVSEQNFTFCYGLDFQVCKKQTEQHRRETFLLFWRDTFFLSLSFKFIETSLRINHGTKLCSLTYTHTLALGFAKARL